MESPTYADYELNKVDTSKNVRLQIRDADGDATHWIMITPATLERLAEVLRTSPEGQW